MKILFVSSGKESGKISPIIEAQGKSLIEIGCDIDYFPIQGKGIKAYLACILTLRNFLKANRFDIIHAHYGLSGIVALLARRKEKLIVSFMGDDLVGSNKENGEITFRSKVLASINIFLSKKFYNRCIVKSKEMLEKIKSNPNVQLIPNGVDMELFQEIERKKARILCGFKEDEINIVFMSRPDRAEKNYKLAQLACRELEPNVKLHTIFGRKQETINAYYSATDILLMTSYHEGSPNVVKEAMACNCPVVSTDVGDIKWLFGDTAGYYITNFNYSEISLKIKNAIEFRKNYGRTFGRRRILNLGLDSQSIAKRIFHVYIQVLNN